MLMPTRRVEALFRGRKPRSLWGGASRTERQQYKRLLGFRRQEQRASFGCKNVFKAACRFEHDIGDRTLWCGSLFNEAFLRTAFKGETKAFVYRHILKSETTQRAKKYANFARSLGINWHDNNWQTFIEKTEKEKSISEAVGKPQKIARLLQQITQARQQLDRAMQQAYSIVFSTKAVQQYPETAAALRHGLLNVQTGVLGNLDELEGMIRIRQKRL